MTFSIILITITAMYALKKSLTPAKAYIRIENNSHKR